MKATFLRPVPQYKVAPGAAAYVYRLDPPLDGHEFVRVSAVSVPFSGPETFIFPSDAHGEVLDWHQLPGSLKGALDHAAALRGAGYEIVP